MGLGDALGRAINRGKHLVKSRVSCDACHGVDFGGAAVVDMAIVGRWVAPNLTSGEGSVTKAQVKSLQKQRSGDRWVRPLLIS